MSIYNNGSYIYTEKCIDLTNLLTLDFGRSHYPLVDSGDNLKKLGGGTRHYALLEHPFWGTGIKYKESWEDIDALKFRSNLKKYHTITINMDPSKIGYENSVKAQKKIIFDVIHYFKNKIKYLALIYERGNGKVHWHMLINIQSVKEFTEALENQFGKGRAVWVKKVQPNNNETLEANMLRILSYFKKEEHNKETLLLSKY